jgi:hypothetical protein
MVTGPDGASEDQVLAQVPGYKAAGATQPEGGPSASPAPVAPQGEPAAKPDQPKGRSGATADVGGDLAFVGGNLSKGVANLAGLPVDTITGAMNLGRAAQGFAARELTTGRNAAPGTRQAGLDYMPPLIEKPFGGGEWFQDMMRRGGAITPAAEPESGAGRYGAAALQFAPGAAIGRPSAMQAPRALMATTTSAVGSEAARDIGGDEWAGVGAMLPGARKMQPKGAGERATEARQAERFDKAREMGIPIPPRDMKPDKPQQKVQNQLNKDLSQPEGTPMDPKTLRAYNAAQYGDYEAVMQSPALAKGVMPNARFQQELQALGNEIEQARGNLPETFKGMRPVLKLLGEYGYAALPPAAQGKITAPPRQQPIPADVTMRAIKKLRSDATTNITSDKPEKVELGMTQRRLANNLEQLIEDNLAQSGQQDLMAKFRSARTNIAKSHDIESSLDPVTRKVNPATLSKLQTEGRPMTGRIADVAEVAGEFPSAMRTSKPDEYFTKRVTPMAVMHPQAMGAHWLSRLFDPITMSAPYQRGVVDPRGYLTPEQQQALRYLSSAQASNRIPQPPE